MNDDFAATQDAVVDSLADIIRVKTEGDTLVSAQALRHALGTMGVPIGIKGLTAGAVGDRDAESLYVGMARIVSLLLDAIDLTIAREEVERL